MFIDASSLCAIAAMMILLAVVRTDVLFRTIPNRFVLAIVALGFVNLTYEAGLQPVQWSFHIGAATALLSAGFLLFTLNWIGAGDVKLLAALAFLTGPQDLAALLVFTSIAGGLMAIAIIAYDRISPWLAFLSTRERQDLPYGVAIAMAGWLLLLPALPN
ncbi:MAG: prepilin peptidase [Geminicoccaceae bacterium]